MKKFKELQFSIKTLQRELESTKRLFNYKVSTHRVNEMKEAVQIAEKERNLVKLVNERDDLNFQYFCLTGKFLD